MTRKKLEGFTYLRAAFSWIIVGWHGNFLGETPLMKVADRYTAKNVCIQHC